MILIDLQKAFDTINHEVLLQKLKAIRFSEQSNQQSLGPTFVTEYLWQKLKINNLIFERFLVELLRFPSWGLFCFWFYVNDMPQVVKSNFLLYADDSCLMYQYKDIAIIEKILKGYLCYKTILCHKAVLDV